MSLKESVFFFKYKYIRPRKGCNLIRANRFIEFNRKSLTIVLFIVYIECYRFVGHTTEMDIGSGRTIYNHNMV